MRIDPQFCCVTRARMAELSKLTTSLWDVWRGDVQVQALAPRAGIVEPGEVTDRLIEATTIP